MSADALRARHSMARAASPTATPAAVTARRGAARSPAAHASFEETLTRTKASWPGATASSPTIDASTRALDDATAKSRSQRRPPFQTSSAT